jgi:hypothetical protein
MEEELYGTRFTKEVPFSRFVVQSGFSRPAWIFWGFHPFMYHTHAS